MIMINSYYMQTGVCMTPSDTKAGDARITDTKNFEQEKIMFDIYF